MKSRGIVAAIGCLLALSLVLGQAPPAQGPAGAQGRGAPQPDVEREVTITAIPGVIAAGAKWAHVWEAIGNNGDGLVAAQDGSLLIGQNDNSQVIRLDGKDTATVLIRDTGSAGALSRDAKGRILGVQRDTPDRGIVILAPERRVLANTFQGKPMTELGRINDLVADGNGGAYFTVGQAYYVSAKGEVTRLSEDLRTNGIVLSPDEKTLYITNGPVVVAYDVQGPGKVANRRDFARLEAGATGGDGLAVDTEGRLYVTDQREGIQVFDRSGKHLGIIPTPRISISAAFAGPDRKMLYFVSPGATQRGANPARAAHIYKVPVLSQGLKDRGK